MEMEMEKCKFANYKLNELSSELTRRASFDQSFQKDISIIDPNLLNVFNYTSSSILTMRGILSVNQDLNTHPLAMFSINPDVSLDIPKTTMNVIVKENGLFKTVSKDASDSKDSYKTRVETKPPIEDLISALSIDDAATAPIAPIAPTTDVKSESKDWGDVVEDQSNIKSNEMKQPKSEWTIKKNIKKNKDAQQIKDAVPKPKEYGEIYIYETYITPFMELRPLDGFDTKFYFHTQFNELYLLNKKTLAINEDGYLYRKNPETNKYEKAIDNYGNNYLRYNIVAQPNDIMPKFQKKSSKDKSAKDKGSKEKRATRYIKVYPNMYLDTNADVADVMFYYHTARHDLYAIGGYHIGDDFKLYQFDEELGCLQVAYGDDGKELCWEYAD